jgi:hypothetical protein
MEELRQLIAQHAEAFNNAIEAQKDPCYDHEFVAQDWDRESVLDLAVQAQAERIGVRLIGHVNPQIELIVLS